MKDIKLIIAGALVVCLLPMPYGYYSLVRFVAMAIFGYYSFLYYEQETKSLAFTFGALALLFQPFIKITLGKGMWNLVDVVVAIFLIVLWNKERKQEKV